MSAQEPEIEAPELEELNSPFRRRLALIVTVVALFGGIVLFKAVGAESQAEQITTGAQRSSIVAMSNNSAVISHFDEELQNSLDVSSLQDDGNIAGIRAALLGMHSEKILANSWERAADQISNVSILSGQNRYAGNPVTLYADMLAGPELAQLRQQAAGETAASWAGKRNTEIGIVTLIAVTLALLGLSLTVQEGIRRYLLIPAGFIVVACLIGFVAVLGRPNAYTPEAAMRAVVAGDRLSNMQDPEGALSYYTQAIGIDPEYPVALVDYANAVILANSPDLGESQYVLSTSTIQAYRAAITEFNQALRINGNDYLALVNLGAAYFHVRDYVDSAKNSQTAIDLNPSPPLPWLNLGLALLGEGNGPAGIRTYDHAIQIVRNLPQPTDRKELFSSAVTELEILAAQQPQRLNLVRQAEGMIVAAEAAGQVPRASSAPNVSVSRSQLKAIGPVLHLQFSYDSLPKHARLAWIVYFRPRGESFWTERADSNHFAATDLAPSGTTTLKLVDHSCPASGEYRVDIYAGVRRLATATAPSSLPGEALTPYDNVVDGVTLCYPATWGLSPAGGITLTSPDGQQQMTIRVTQIPSSRDLRHNHTLIGNVLNKMTEELSAHAVVLHKRSYTFGGIKGVLWTLRLPGGDRGVVWASHRTGGILRTLEEKFPAGNHGALKDIATYLLF